MSLKINFEKIEIRNFLSFGNVLQEIDLSFNETSLILGENLDAQSANGAGKTTIINAIAYALFNKPATPGISKERLINKTNNSKNTKMEVRLIFNKGGVEYEIYRSRGENYVIQLFKDGEDITPDSVSEIDKKIIDIIGCSYELFCRVVIFSGNDQPFLEMPVGTQRQLIEELFNITVLSEKAVKLREKIKTTESDINVQSALISQQEQNKEAHEKRIQDAKARVDRWEKEKAKSTADIIKELEKIASVDFDAEEHAHQTIAEITPVVSKLKTQQSSLKKDIASKEKRMNEIEHEIEHLLEAKCPYCLQKYENESKIEELGIELEKIISELEEHRMSLEKFEEDLSLNTKKLNDAKSNIKFSSLTELTRSRSNVAVLETRFEELSNSSNPHSEAYEQLKAEEFEEISFEELDALRKLLEHQQFLLKLLIDKNSFVRKKIINRTIPFLNSRINHYTSTLGLPHIVKFDADMSCAVSEYDRELDFGNLSGGEKKRVNLALSLAFRDVFHQRHGKVNALFLDEIDGGSVDSNGVDAMIKLLKQKSRDEDLGIWIISHRPEMIGRFTREITIRKQNGFSSIIYHDE